MLEEKNRVKTNFTNKYYIIYIIVVCKFAKFGQVFLLSEFLTIWTFVFLLINIFYLLIKVLYFSFYLNERNLKIKKLSNLKKKDFIVIFT